MIDGSLLFAMKASGLSDSVVDPLMTISGLKSAIETIKSSEVHSWICRTSISQSS
jgi:hypothetical protein